MATLTTTSSKLYGRWSTRPTDTGVYLGRRVRTTSGAVGVLVTYLGSGRYELLDRRNAVHTTTADQIESVLG